ncbi:lipocalin family protein [Chryseobacterium sp. Leaf394]|uniref:lipocalin family protein n=1 Tax=Chryseobacterium sp. Leaf394 TaxID=1736361 RepID=UPI0006F5D80E|nr:lipocalin family protein [Chryseobacterium sp. Leaf394]KQS89395.1 hypothetical protein ASG21_16600 [Chryseobacterium sp. Leaf394]
MKAIAVVLFLFYNSLAFGQIRDDKRLIDSQWEFKVFSDTIAFPNLPEVEFKTKNKIFFKSIMFTEKNFTAKTDTGILNGKWILLGNNLQLNFSNKTSLLYEVMRLNSDRLELKEEGMLISNLGYDRKK